MNLAFAQHEHLIAHSVFYLAACIASLCVALWQKKALSFPDNPALGQHYMAWLFGGFVLGAYGFGSWNVTVMTGVFAMAHSVLGALTGGIIAVELYKFFYSIKGATGGAFALPLAIGIAVGRIGCLLGGIADQTFGSATHTNWGVNFGDGVLRHPVQLYESVAMLVLSVFFVRWAMRNQQTYLRYSFHVFILVYAAQRFVWEWLKDYPAIVGPFNLFHILCLALMGYAGSMLFFRRGHDVSTS